MKLLLKTDFSGRPPRPMLRGKIWYIRQRIAGRDTWRSLHTQDRREAEYLAIEIWRMRQSSELRSVIPAPPRKLDLIWEAYANSDRFKLLADSTRFFKAKTWNSFRSWCKQRKIEYPHQLTREICLEYLERNQGKNKTFNNILSDLGQVFQAGELENPFAQIEKRSIHRAAPEKQSERFQAFTDSEIAQILESLEQSKIRNRDEWIAACRIAMNTGLRYKDIALLQFSSIEEDDRGRYLCLAPHKTAAKTGGRVVYIRLTRELDDLLRDRRAKIEGDFVLPGLSGEYANLGLHATKPFSKICHRLGIAGSFHSFRVTFITKAAKAGIDLETLGGVVGHATKTQTQAYNRAALELDISAILGKDKL